MDDQIKSRRDFIAGALTTVACASCSCGHDHSHDETEVQPSGEKVKLLSVTGEVIEVDRAFLKPVPDLPQTWQVEGEQAPRETVAESVGVDEELEENVPEFQYHLAGDGTDGKLVVESLSGEIRN